VSQAPDAAGLWPAQAVANHALAGEAVLDTSTASTAVPLFDFTGWDEALVTEIGARVEQLPRLVPTGWECGRVAHGAGEPDADGPASPAASSVCRVAGGGCRPRDVLVISARRSSSGRSPPARRRCPATDHPAHRAGKRPSAPEQRGALRDRAMRLSQNPGPARSRSGSVGRQAWGELNRPTNLVPLRCAHRSRSHARRAAGRRATYEARVSSRCLDAARSTPDSRRDRRDGRRHRGRRVGAGRRRRNRLPVDCVRAEWRFGLRLADRSRARAPMAMTEGRASDGLSNPSPWLEPVAE
jgi:hypothetical protein